MTDSTLTLRPAGDADRAAVERLAEMEDAERRVRRVGLWRAPVPA